MSTIFKTPLIFELEGEQPRAVNSNGIRQLIK